MGGWGAVLRRWFYSECLSYKANVESCEGVGVCSVDPAEALALTKVSISRAVCLLSPRDRADLQLQPRLFGQRENSLSVWGLQLQRVPRGQTEGKGAAPIVPS